MKIPYSFSGVNPLWINGSPSAWKKQTRVKATIEGTANYEFPRSHLPKGDLLTLERDDPSPQHAVTLLLSFPKSITVGMPEATVWGQIFFALPAEAVAQIRDVEGGDYEYELNLKGMELEYQPTGWTPPT